MEEINWQGVSDQFGKEMLEKLAGLPPHQGVPGELKELRSIISHELPETASKILFRKLINLLLSGGKPNIKKIRKVYVEPELLKEEKILTKNKEEFGKLGRSAKRWVEKNFFEEKLQKLWKAHKTWLPRRYLVYRQPPTFQKTAADTLVRFYLLKDKPQE